jgi:hypothetical protein
MGGCIEEVKRQLTEVHDSRLNAELREKAVEGYAMSGFFDEVCALLFEARAMPQSASLYPRLRKAAIRGFINGGHTAQLDVLLQVDLFKRISDLQAYGINLQSQSSIKGEKVIQLANRIRAVANQFLLGDCQEAAARSKMSQAIMDGQRSMGEDRNLRDKITHVLVALTGIGLIIMLGKFFFTQSHSVYFNFTKRQEMLNAIGNEIPEMFNRETQNKPG